MDLDFIDKEITEARLFRSTRQFGTLTGRDVANLLYLNTLATYMMAQDSEQQEFAREYAADTVKFSGYTLFRTHATDMYLLAYQVLHPTNDHISLSNGMFGKHFLKNLNFNSRMHIAFLRKIAKADDHRAEAITYLYRLELQLGVDDQRYKRWRRLATDWNSLKFSQKQVTVVQIIQEIRRLGAGGGRGSEIMIGLSPMLKYRRYKNIIRAPLEPAASTADKVAGALVGAYVGRKAAAKLSTMDTGKAKKLGTGLGAIAGYWSAGRKKVK